MLLLVLSLHFSQFVSVLHTHTCIHTHSPLAWGPVSGPGCMRQTSQHLWRTGAYYIHTQTHTCPCGDCLCACELSPCAAMQLSFPQFSQFFQFPLMRFFFFFKSRNTRKSGLFTQLHTHHRRSHRCMHITLAMADNSSSQRATRQLLTKAVFV